MMFDENCTEKIITVSLKKDTSSFIRLIIGNNANLEAIQIECSRSIADRRNNFSTEEGHNLLQIYQDDHHISGVWNCHARLARLVHRTCRTSRFSWIACPGTSKDQQIKIISV